jgi:hypothetical protein
MPKKIITLAERMENAKKTMDAQNTDWNNKNKDNVLDTDDLKKNYYIDPNSGNIRPKGGKRKSGKKSRKGRKSRKSRKIKRRS